VTAIAYHDTVNELHGAGLAGKGPFASLAWFSQLEQAGHKPWLPTVHDERGLVSLPLTRKDGRLEPLTNWYAFTWGPLATPGAPDYLYTELASGLRRQAITLSKLTAEDADILQQAFAAAGFMVTREVCDTNHYLPVDGRSFAGYLAARPGPLRTTLKRKAKKVEVRLTRSFEAADWAAYEEIYRQSWKPAEGDPALLRRFAEAESAAGHYLFGLALADGEPVAAQFWTVEQGIAYIHKLAHLPSAEAISPGTTLTAALMEQVIDHDRVTEVDFGTGSDRYKADWMEATRPRFTLRCHDPRQPAQWPAIIRATIRKLVSPAHAG
jgi:hypothetical protein